MTPDRAAEHAARHSYGRLLAYLAARSGDIAAAEDALSDALAAALQTWPKAGVPKTPDAWLLTAARRRLTDQHRRRATTESAIPDLMALATAAVDADSADAVPDERLKLMFVCAHPAIDAAARTPLMLQTVIGIDAARIAGAFVASPTTMGQRLVRAKKKIRDAGIHFAIPDNDDLPDRLEPVLEAIYGAFSIGWDAASVNDATAGDLAAEAIDLGRVLVELMPEQPEALGLMSLMLYAHARRDARLDAAGRFCPLTEQDVAAWDIAMVREAEAMLARAARLSRPGRFQTEAAIQSVYVARLAGQRIDQQALVMLHSALLEQRPTVGSMVSYAAALAAAGDVAGGLAALDRIAPATRTSFQPYWAVLAHIYALAGKRDEADDAYGRAIGLSKDAAVRQFLLVRRQANAQKA